MEGISMLRLRSRYLLICTGVIFASAIYYGMRIRTGDYVALADGKLHYGIVPWLSPASQAAAVADSYGLLFLYFGVAGGLATRERLASGITRSREYATSALSGLLLAVPALAACIAMIPLAASIPGPLVLADSYPLPLAFAFAYATFVIMFQLGYAATVTYQAAGGPSILAFVLIVILIDILLDDLGMPLIFGESTVAEAGTDFPAGVVTWLVFGAAIAIIARASVRSMRIGS